MASIGQDQGKSLTTEPILGSIGIFKKDIISDNFSPAGIAELDEKIRITKEFQSFKKSNLKRYNKVILNEEEKLKIVDSINLHPEYFRFEIGDKVGLIKALNNSGNKSLKEYLEVTRGNQILIGVDIYFPQEITALINNATEIYLINNKKSSYSLELLNKDRSSQIINFDQGKPFSFHFMSFCWKENYKGKAEIAAFRNLNSSCPGSTFKDPEKINSKDIFDKYN